jgi:hypothetical protein
MKYRELQKELKARGLKSHGKKADLELRIIKAMASEEQNE